jgi:hypothetical protein
MGLAAVRSQRDCAHQRGDMKSVFAVVVVGIIGFALTAFNPAQEMWAPLIVALVPLLAFMLWPVREEASRKG